MLFKRLIHNDLYVIKPEIAKNKNFFYFFSDKLIITYFNEFLINIPPTSSLRLYIN